MLLRVYFKSIAKDDNHKTESEKVKTEGEGENRGSSGDKRFSQPSYERSREGKGKKKGSSLKGGSGSSTSCPWSINWWRQTLNAAGGPEMQPQAGLAPEASPYDAGLWQGPRVMPPIFDVGHSNHSAQLHQLGGARTEEVQMAVCGILDWLGSPKDPMHSLGGKHQTPNAL